MIVNARLIKRHVFHIKTGIIINVNVSLKSIVRLFKKHHLDSIIVCSEILSFTNSVLTNVTNTISTNVTNIVSINSDNKKVRYKMDCYMYKLCYLLSLRKT